MLRGRFGQLRRGKRRRRLQSFDFPTLREIAARDPRTPLSALTASRWSSLAGVARRAGSDIVSLHETLVNARPVERVHALGAQVHPYTVNDAAGWDRMVAAGVDGIINDDPERLISY